MAIIRNRKGGTRPILSALETSAMTHVADAYPMPSVALGRPGVSDRLYQGFEDIDVVDPELYAKYDVKRGLRNADGSGVLVGLSTISNVHGYNKTPEGVVPDEGDLIYRGYHIADLIDHAQSEDRFGGRQVETAGHPAQKEAEALRPQPIHHSTQDSVGPAVIILMAGKGHGTIFFCFHAQK